MGAPTAACAADRTGPVHADLIVLTKLAVTLGSAPARLAERAAPCDLAQSPIGGCCE